MQDNLTFKELTQVGTLRQALQYKSREAMNNNWKAQFNGAILPEDHLHIEPFEVITFIRNLSQSKRGRPGNITIAAQELLKMFDAPKPVPTLNVLFQELPVKVQPTEPEKAQELEQKIEPVQIVTVEEDSEPENLSFIKQIKGFTALDWVYIVTVFTADYGAIMFAKEMGAAFGLVYTLVSFHAMKMAKDRHSQETAKTGIGAVWVLEILAFFIHLSMFNAKIWQSIDQLPFQVTNITNESRPFYIAVVLAFLFASAGIYAVTVTLSLVQEKKVAKQFEADFKQEY